MKTWIFVTAIALFIAAMELPYWYYQLLRWDVSAMMSFICLMFLADDKPNKLLVIACLMIALFFNPIIPFTFEKHDWIVIDVVVGVYSLGLLWLLPNEKVQEKNE